MWLQCIQSHNRKLRGEALCAAQVPRNIFPCCLMLVTHSWWNRATVFKQLQVKKKSSVWIKRSKDTGYFTPKTFFFLLLNETVGVNVQQTKITPVSFWELHIPSCSNLIQQVTRLCSLSRALPGTSGGCPLRSLWGSCREKDGETDEGSDIIKTKQIHWLTGCVFQAQMPNISSLYLSIQCFSSFSSFFLPYMTALLGCQFYGVSELP